MDNEVMYQRKSRSNKFYKEILLIDNNLNFTTNFKNLDYGRDC